MRHEALPASRSDLVGALSDQGYYIVRGALPISAVHALDRHLAPVFEATPFCEGGFYGERTKRFGRLLARAPDMERFVRNHGILAMATDVLAPWSDTIQLNQLPLPDVVERLDYETLLATAERRMRELWPAYTATV